MRPRTTAQNLPIFPDKIKSCGVLILIANMNDLHQSGGYELGYDPKEIVNLIYFPEPGKEEFVQGIELAEAISVVLKQPSNLKHHFVITREDEPIETYDQLVNAAKILGIGG